MRIEIHCTKAEIEAIGPERLAMIQSLSRPSAKQLQALYDDSKLFAVPLVREYLAIKSTTNLFDDDIAGFRGDEDISRHDPENVVDFLFRVVRYIAMRRGGCIDMNLASWYKTWFDAKFAKDSVAVSKHEVAVYRFIMTKTSLSTKLKSEDEEMDLP